MTVQQAPSITNGPPSDANLNSSYSFAYTASGYPAPTFSLSSGSLPPGLTLSTTGVISGTPTQTGTFTGTVTATNGVASDASQSFKINITNATTPTLPTWGLVLLTGLLLVIASRFLPRRL